jgi:hypothetical protein
LIKAGRGHVERAGDKIKEYVTVFNYVAVELERAPGTPTGRRPPVQVGPRHLLEGGVGVRGMSRPRGERHRPSVVTSPRLRESHAWPADDDVRLIDFLAHSLINALASC